MPETNRKLIGAEISVETRDALLEIAAARGEGWTFSAVVRTALDAYVKNYRRRKPVAKRQKASA